MGQEAFANGDSTTDDMIWYFAYGSNMNPKVFGPDGRTLRNCKPKEIKTGYAPGWRLMCNMRAVPILEPGMGNIIPLSALSDKHEQGSKQISEHRDTQCVHGVCYLVSKHEFDDIYHSEGGKIGSYVIQKLKILTYDGEQLEGHACYCPYNSGRCDINLDLPSKRYITLLRDGAKHWQLHPKYCEYLDNYPHADYPKWFKYPFVGGILFPILGPFFAMIFICKTMDRLTGGTIFKRSFPYLMLYYFRPAMRVLWGILDLNLSYILPILGIGACLFYTLDLVTTLNYTINR